jgi:hypothetical protein
MGFIPISIDKYVAMHLELNPNENEADLRIRLNKALSDYQNGIRCQCGNDIWVVGSASIGNSCYSCITGEAYPADDYEIDSAVKKRENKNGRRHIDDIDPTKICGIFDDDGYEITDDLIKKPSICLTCINDGDPHEEVLCNLTRYDQRDEKEFICYAYKQLKH